MVTNGLSRHQDSLNDATLTAYERATLASSVVYVATLAVSKFSILFFLGRLLSAPQITFRKLMQATWIVMGLYLLSEVLTISFQCSLPTTYHYINGQYINLLALWDFDAVFDVVSSLVILALPIIIVRPVLIPASRKFQAVSGFTFQIPACGFAVVRLTYLHKALAAEDHTWAAVDWQRWTAINMHFNVIAANIPCLKIFLEGFQSMLFRHDLANQYGSSESRNRSQASASGSHIRTQDKGRSAAKPMGSDPKDFSPDDAKSSTAIVVSSDQDNSIEKFNSSDNSDDYRIHKTVEWTVLETRIERESNHN